MSAARETVGWMLLGATLVVVLVWALGHIDATPRGHQIARLPIERSQP